MKFQSISCYKIILTNVLLLSFFVSYFKLCGQSNIVIPKEYVPVQDLATVLKVNDLQRLTQNLLDYERESSNQIVFAIVKSIDGKNLKDFANDWANKMGVGQKEYNNGIFVLIVMDTRDIRIEIGYGLEKFIPDIAASDIIENQMKPAFRKELYALGIENAITEFKKYLSGYYANNPRLKNSGNAHKWFRLKSENWINLSVILFFVLFYNLLYTSKISRKSANLEIKIPFLIFFNLMYLYYAIRFGLWVDPEFKILIFHGTFGFVLLILFIVFLKNLSSVWTKVFLASFIIMLSILAVFLHVQKLLIEVGASTLFYWIDLIVLSGLASFLFCGIILLIFTLIFALIFGSDSGEGSDYTISGSTSNGSGSSSSSSGSKSSFGGGSFGGGGASGSW